MTADWDRSTPELKAAFAAADPSVMVIPFVLPVFAILLPAPWNNRVVAVTLPYLAPQLSGTIENAPLTPAWAAVAMVAYLVAALGGGALALFRRDA
jgi:Zn-dependent protease